jgi:hypothetical protein
MFASPVTGLLIDAVFVYAGILLLVVGKINNFEGFDARPLE